MIRNIFRQAGFSSVSAYAHTRPITRTFQSSARCMADVELSIDNGIRTITMNRPNKLNAITNDMYTVMAQHLNESNTDKNTKIIVITGAGERSFTSGYDLACLVEDSRTAKKTPEENGASKFIQSLIQCRKPLVGLVNGNAVGIGVTLLAHCEAVYASEKAMLNTPFIVLGIPPECCSSYLLPKIMGHAKAGELLHFNASITAQEGYESGLITKVFPHEAFMTKAMEKVKQMAEHPLQNLVTSKALLRDSERDLLMQVHRRENEDFKYEIIGPAAEALLASRKKK